MKLEIQAVEFKSTNIKSIEFLTSSDENLKLDDKGDLLVTFQTSKRYVYYDVPFSMVIDLITAESLGKRFNTTILSNNFKYQSLQ